jgi:diacylglycerol kinase
LSSYVLVGAIFNVFFLIKKHLAKHSFLTLSSDCNLYVEYFCSAVEHFADAAVAQRVISNHQFDFQKCANTSVYTVEKNISTA